MDVISIVAPIFLLLALGYALRALGVIAHSAIHALNSFVYWVSLPSVILLSFWNINWFDPETQRVLLFNLLALFAFSALLIVILRSLPLGNAVKAALFIAALVGNTVYMGFPLGEGALGAHQFHLFVAAATPHLVIGIAFAILAIEYYVIASRRLRAYAYDFFVNPLILSLIAGIVLSVIGFSGPAAQFLQQPLTMLAGTASPLALVTLGAFLRGTFLSAHLKTAAGGVALKLIALPALVLLLGFLWGLSAPSIAASTLAAAMPTAVTAFVIAEKYRVEPALVANMLFVSTVASLVTLSAVIALVTSF